MGGEVDIKYERDLASFVLYYFPNTAVYIHICCIFFPQA